MWIGSDSVIRIDIRSWDISKTLYSFKCSLSIRIWYTSLIQLSHNLKTLNLDVNWYFIVMHLVSTNLLPFYYCCFYCFSSLIKLLMDLSTPIYQHNEIKMVKYWNSFMIPFSRIKSTNIIMRLPFIYGCVKLINLHVLVLCDFLYFNVSMIELNVINQTTDFQSTSES